MNLNSINYESVDDQYDPGYFSEHENVSQGEPADNYDENLHKAMLLQVYSALDSFDSTNGGSMTNPYQDRIALETSTGSVQIPLEIQKAAINQWVNLKKNNNLQNNQVDKESSFDMVDSLFQFLLCILIIFTLMYTLSLFRKGVIRF